MRTQQLRLRHERSRCWVEQPPGVQQGEPRAQLADHYVEQEEIMLATETFMGKLSLGARPGQSVQLHPEAMGRLKRRRTNRAPARSCSSSSK
jgi:hypothetical protein